MEKGDNNRYNLEWLWKLDPSTIDEIFGSRLSDFEMDSDDYDREYTRVENLLKTHSQQFIEERISKIVTRLRPFLKRGIRLVAKNPCIIDSKPSLIVGKEYKIVQILENTFLINSEISAHRFDFYSYTSFFERVDQ